MYNKKEWVSKEVITKEALNNIENGIYENCINIANLSINEVIDFTIKDSFNIKNSDEETDNSYFHFATITTNRAGVESREFWILINARYDKETKRFKRIDLDNFSFGWQMQASGTYPGEESFGDYINQGVNLWKANGRKAYPVGSADYDLVTEDIGVEIDGKWYEFGYMHGWNNHFMNDSYGGMTIGGSGFEVDGSGLHPYIRLSRNKYRGGSREFDNINDYEFGYAGIIENSFHGLTGKDANHKKGLFFGFKSDIEEIEPRTFVDEETSYFTIMEHPAGAEDVIEEWTEIYKFKPSGEIEVTPNGRLYSFPCTVLSSTDFQFLFDYMIPINQNNAKLKYIDCKKSDGTHEIKKVEELYISFTEAGCNGYVLNEGEPYQSITAFVENKDEMYDVILKNTKSDASIKMNYNGDIEINATNKVLINGVDVNKLLQDSGLLIETKIKPVKVWSIRENINPIYSTPIVTTFMQNNRLVISHQSFDWSSYVRDFHTGEILAVDWYEGPLYGRPQAEDVNGDNLREFFYSSHAGEIYCFNENGEFIWSQFSEFKRQGTGFVTSQSENIITDDTKNWADGWGEGDHPFTFNVINGAGAGQSIEIERLSGTTITLKEAPSVALDATSEYTIEPPFESNHIIQHAGTLHKEGEQWFLYVTGFDHCCRKINAATGEVVWVTTTKADIEPFPLLADLNNDGIDEVYFVSVDGGIYCCNLEGEQQWLFITENGNDAFLNTINLSSGEKALVVSSRDSRVYLINADGELIDRTTPTNADIDCRPVVYDFDGDGKEEFIVGGDAGFVYCFNENCETLWRKHLGIYINSSPIMADVNYDGQMEVIVSDMNGTMTIFNPVTGHILHEIHCHGGVEGTPAIGDFDNDGLIEMVVTTTEGFIELYRFNK